MTDRLVAPNVERLTPYSPGKPIEELERELGITGAIKLASNESPAGPSPRAVEAIARAAREAHRYPDAGGFALRQDLAAHHRVAMNELALGNGSNDLIDLLVRTFATPDEHVVLGDPSFVCYALSTLAANVPFTLVPLRERLYWNVDDLLSAVRPTTKLLYLASPNNPTGTHLPGPELRRLLAELPPRVIAVIDEAYVQFADAPDFETALSMRETRERLVVLRTFSKAYGLAALRVGYAIAPAAVVDYVNRVRPPFNVSAIAQAAARAALADPDHVAAYVELNARERARLTAGLRERGVEVPRSQANFVLASFGRPGREIYDALLPLGVIVRPLPPPLEASVRITVGLPAENDRLLSAVERVARS